MPRKLFTVAISLLWFASMQAQSLEDYQSLFIIKFIENMKWDDDSRVPQVGILGNSKILPVLSSKAKENESSFKVSKIGYLDGVVDFDVVFIPASSSRSIAQIARLVGNKKVLLITEGQPASQSMKVDIRIYVESDRLKFAYSSANLEAKDIKISQRILQLGREI